VAGQGSAAARGLSVLEIATSQGPARADLRRAPDPIGALVLGHGASGGIGARDLVTVAETAPEQGFSVALVEQPYRVAGRRTPPPAARLDAAWTAVVQRLRDGPLEGLPLVAGGRSSGARVACRTAAATGAAAVLCLAFPLVPPRRGPRAAANSRLPELDAVTVPTLVVQGVADSFGVPPDAPRRTVVRVPGTHALTADLSAVSSAVRAWLADLAGELRGVRRPAAPTVDGCRSPRPRTARPR
jgi:uncharacterized protein